MRSSYNELAKRVIAVERVSSQPSFWTQYGNRQKKLSNNEAVELFLK